MNPLVASVEVISTSMVAGGTTGTDLAIMETEGLIVIRILMFSTEEYCRIRIRQGK